MSLTIKDAVFIIYTGNDYVPIEDRHDTMKKFNDTVGSPIELIVSGVTGDQNKAKPWAIMSGDNITQEDIDTAVDYLTGSFKGLRLTIKDNETNEKITDVYYRDTRDSEVKKLSYAEWVSLL